MIWIKNRFLIKRPVPCSLLLMAFLFAAWFPIGGCTNTVRVTMTSRSSIEQELLVRSLERALFNLDVAQFVGNKVFFELHALTGDQGFAK